MNKVLGWVEEVAACDCCGKTGLSGTFAVETADGLVHYGSTCVTRNTGIRNPKAAAASYVRERQLEAATKLKASPAFLAYRAAIARVAAAVDRGEIEPGLASRRAVAAESAALDAVRSALIAEYRVSHIPA